MQPGRLSNSNFLVQASATPTPTDAKQRIAEFELPDKILEVERLLPFCPWAKRYVEIAAALGSMCEWQPFYNGQPVDSPLAREAIKLIKPEHGSQRDLRRRALSLQRSIGMHGIVAKDTHRGVSWGVAHPDNLEKSKTMTETGFGYLTRPDAKPGKPGHCDLPIGQLARHHIPDTAWPDLPFTELTNVLEFMRLYCSILEAALATVDQRKIASSILHLKLDEQPDKEWGAYDPEPDSDGELSEEEKTISDMYATWRKGYEQGGVTRIAPHALWWQGTVDLIEFGPMLPAETIDSLDQVSRRAVEGLPIPNVFLLDGTGTSNHWGDAEVRRELHNHSVYPELEPHDDAFTVHAFRPIMGRILGSDLKNGLEGADNIDLWELRSDRQKIDVRSDNSAQMIELYKCGIISRNALIDKLPDVHPADLLELPEGESETDLLLQLQGRAARRGSIDLGGGEPEPAPDPPAVPQVVAAGASVLDYMV